VRSKYSRKETIFPQHLNLQWKTCCCCTHYSTCVIAQLRIQDGTGHCTLAMHFNTNTNTNSTPSSNVVKAPNGASPQDNYCRLSCYIWLFDCVIEDPFYTHTVSICWTTPIPQAKWSSTMGGPRHPCLILQGTIVGSMLFLRWHWQSGENCYAVRVQDEELRRQMYRNVKGSKCYLFFVES